MEPFLLGLQLVFNIETIVVVFAAAIFGVFVGAVAANRFDGDWCTQQHHVIWRWAVWRILGPVSKMHPYLPHQHAS